MKWLFYVDLTIAVICWYHMVLYIKIRLQDEHKNKKHGNKYKNKKSGNN
jgi:hypothetical protein